MRTKEERKEAKIKRLKGRLVEVTKRLNNRIDRTERLLLLGAIIDKIKIDVNLEDEPAFIELFNKVWPVFEPVLQWLKLLEVTGEKIDAVIQTVIDIGWRISKGEASEEEQTEWLKEFDKLWTTIKIALEIIKLFVKEKIDEIIDKIILIGDWVTDEDYEVV